jgi:hypothetical protein
MSPAKIQRYSVIDRSNFNTRLDRGSVRPSAQSYEVLYRPHDIHDVRRLQAELAERRQVCVDRSQNLVLVAASLLGDSEELIRASQMQLDHVKGFSLQRASRRSTAKSNYNMD